MEFHSWYVIENGEEITIEFSLGDLSVAEVTVFAGPVRRDDQEPVFNEKIKGKASYQLTTGGDTGPGEFWPFYAQAISHDADSNGKQVKYAVKQGGKICQCRSGIKQINRKGGNNHAVDLVKVMLVEDGKGNPPRRHFDVIEESA